MPGSRTGGFRDAADEPENQRSLRDQREEVIVKYAGKGRTLEFRQGVWRFPRGVYWKWSAERSVSPEWTERGVYWKWSAERSVSPE
jgi:hypothetical protein